ncbi:MAG TPA: DUF1697 domain-containing protein [Candidatus Nesterenkonia stercoripullorum]|uniref:DUF1697 domain-containing protein n=1 Tax=Candidatus Nesterenkonia stercoripullorum TaxID=2838701 RepID=A0A9D1URM5_9MICC|nr:DUF1697 domain-containing protein [Candidatus Nesterenkonia stercoripullorum]
MCTLNIMDRRIVLVRAVNVGGTAKLPMAQWRELAESLGASDVATYIASGNLVCTIPGDHHGFDRALESAVEERFGFFREVISRSPQQVSAALTNHPFDVVEPKFSYVTFLAGVPTADAIAAARKVPTGEDRWEVVGAEMHIRYAEGAGRAQMKDAAIGRALGVAGTARNLNTVRKLVELAAC